MEVVRWKKRRFGVVFETGESIMWGVGRFVVLGQERWSGLEWSME